MNVEKFGLRLLQIGAAILAFFAVVALIAVLCSIVSWAFFQHGIISGIVALLLLFASASAIIGLILMIWFEEAPK